MDEYTRDDDIGGDVEEEFIEEAELPEVEEGEEAEETSEAQRA